MVRDYLVLVLIVPAFFNQFKSIDFFFKESICVPKAHQDSRNFSCMKSKGHGVVSSKITLRLDFDMKLVE